MVGNSTGGARELAQLIHGMAEHLRITYQNCDGVALAPLPMEVMQTIVQSPGLTVAEISSLLGKFPSNISVAVKDLDSKDLVRRETNPTDKRFVRLFPSDLAIEKVELVYDSWERQITAGLAALPRAEANRILAAQKPLTKLAHSLGNDQKPLQ